MTAETVLRRRCARSTLLAHRSALALAVFGAAGYRRRADTGSNAAIVLLAITVTAVVLGVGSTDEPKEG